MDNDLSLSQSLGGLYIANPDTTSPGISQDVPTNPRIDASSIPARTADVTDAPPPPVSRDSRASTDPQPQSRRHSIFNILRRGEPSPDTTPSSRAPPQYLEGKPASPNPRTDSSSSESYQAQSDPLARAVASKAYRQSMPLNHQAQQQAQFPPYQSNAMQNGNRGYPPCRLISTCFRSLLSSSSTKCSALPRTRLIQTKK